VTSKDILVHPGYEPSSLSNDIAILRLPRELRLGGKVQRVSLPPTPALAGCQLSQYDAEQLRIEREQCSLLGNPIELLYQKRYKADFTRAFYVT